MTGTAQHGLHPDAECLNAFAEHALGEGERDGVLRHLAGCSRCRQVVALAQRAVESEVFEKVAAAAAPRPAVQPNAWWKRWRLIWAPAAVAATLAVTSVSFYLRQAEQRNSPVRIAVQSPKNGSAQASSPPPTELAESASLASPASATPAAKTPRARESEATPSLRQRQREGPVLAGKPQSLNQLAPSPPATAQSLPPQGNLAPRLTFEGFTSQGKPAIYQSSASLALQAEKKKPDLEKQQAQADALRGRLFAASAARAAGRQGTGNGASGNAGDQAPVTTDRTGLRPTPAASFGVLGELKPDVLSAARASGPIYLPSGLRAISFADAGGRRIALDQTGTLFLSGDAGRTWERVPMQWTGHAIMVRRAPDSPVQLSLLAAQAAGNQPAALEAEPPVVFEIVNDESHVWRSADGKTWTAK